MDIHVDQLIDYITCPLLYDFKHNKEIKADTTERGRPNKHSILELYDKALHKAIGSLFHAVQEGFYPGIHFLSKKWGFLWVKPRAEQEDIRFRTTSWRDTHERKRQQGWNKLKALWEYYKENPGTPIMVDYPYTIPIGKHVLRGTIDLVRVVKNEQGREYIELTEFVTDERNAPFLHIRRDWRVTAATLAFREIMNVKAEKIVYHGIISGKLQPTTRDESDYQQLEKLLNSIELARNHNIFYPVFNERCLTCPYEKHCEKGWS
jgi:hypothetical protein